MSVSPEQPKNREIELRAFDIDGEAFRETLRSLGAVSLGTKEFKRAVLDVHPVNPNKWIRVRTDGVETTWSVKERLSDEANGTFEAEQVVESFEKTLEILAAMGLEPRSVQESRRDAYTLDGAEVSIDRWPQLQEFIEIEAHDEETIHRVAELLGVPAEALTAKSVEQHYLDTLAIDVKTSSLVFDAQE